MSETGPGGSRLRARLLAAFFACIAVLAALAWRDFPAARPAPEDSRAALPSPRYVSQPLPCSQPALATPSTPVAQPPPAVLDRLPDIRLQRRAVSPRTSDSPRQLLRLKSGTFELLAGAPFAVRGDREYLVAQFRDEPTAADRLELERIGARILEYLPDRAYVLDVPAEAAGGLRFARYLRAIGNLYPQDKLSPALSQPAESAPEPVELRVSLFATADFALAAAELTALGARLLSAQPSPTGAIRLTAYAKDVASIAGLAGVCYVEPGEPPRRVASAMAGSRSNVQSALSAPYGVDGTGVKIGVWDGGLPEASHPDLTGRVTVVDAAALDLHATQVAGIIAGSGRASPAARGQAPAASLFAFDFVGDPVQECRDAAARDGLSIANHSWGHAIGFQAGGTCGQTYCNTGGQQLFGFYSGAAQDFDQMVVQTGLIVVKAAGDDRDDGTNASSHDGLQVSGEFYETMEDQACAKNVLTVGATTDGDRVASYSSWGPCDDGRVKPDLVAVGDRVVAPAPGGVYQQASGTSMGAANVSGQLALFLDAHTRYGGGAPRASRVKAIALNSCTDIVAAPYAGAGPDYTSGFGLLDAQQMLALAYTELHAPFVKQTLSGSFSSSDETTHTTFSVGDARQELRVTLAWTDPQGSLLAGPALVNDLDLRLLGPDGTVWMPWVLDPANPSAAATRGNNSVDPVEQVALTRAGVVAAGKIWPGTWRVIVRAGTIAKAPQAWDLAATVALTARPNGSDPVVTISNPPANASGRQKVIASVTAATGRTVVAVQYRAGAGAWLAMVRNQSTGSYESVVDYVVTTSAGELLTVRAVDDTVREGRATRSLTHVFSDDHPNLASGTGLADVLTPNGAAGQGVIEPAGSSPEAGDFFQVPLSTGVRYQLEAAGADGVALELSLFSTDGTTVLTRTTGALDVSGTQSVARLLDTSVAADGTYYVRVSQGDFTPPAQPRYDYSVRVFTVTGVARIAASPTSGSPGFSVTFSNRSFGPLASFLWDFGDGLTSTAISPTHVYSSPGVYQVRMRADGQFASNVVDITATGTTDDHPGNRFESFEADDILTVDGPALPGVIDSSSDNDLFKLTLASGQSVVLDVLTGTLQDSKLTVQTSSGGNPGGVLTDNDDPVPTYVRSSHLVFTAPSADTYLLLVSGPNGKTGSYSLRARTLAGATNLKVTAISAPSSLPVSQVALFTVTVSNSSTVAVTVPFKLGVGTTVDNPGFNSTFQIRREVLYRDGIPAGQSITVQLALSIELAGAITFWGVVNSDHAVPETNVDDNLLSQGTAISLTRRTHPPRLRAGPERSVAVNTAAGLNASATDPEGASLSYSWRRLLGPDSPLIVNATLANASVTPTAAGRYRFLVTASDGQDGTATAPVDVWAYETVNADFDVQSVTSGSGTTFTQRQTGRRLSFTGRNRGGHVAFVDRATLKFMQGASDVSSGFVVRPVGVGPSFLLTGAGGSWDFDVDVLPTSVSGANIVVHGVLEGTDAQTTQAKSDSQATGPLMVTVRAAATATIQPADAPGSIEPGQTILFTVPVRNSGDVEATALAATLTFGAAPLSVVPRASNPVTATAVATASFGFDVSAPLTITAGPATATFSVTGVDGATGFQLSSARDALAVLNVLSAPELVIVSFSVPRPTASVGQTIPATVIVRNSGGASVQFTHQALVLSGTSLEAAGVTRTFSLAGENATTAIPFSLQAVGAGATSLTSAVFTARNLGTSRPVGLTSNLASPVTVTVQMPSALDVVAIVPERLTATQEQTFTTTVTVRNSGGATALISRATASFGNVGLTAAAISSSRSLVTSGETSFTFQVRAAAAGSTSIEGATFEAVDENSGAALPAPTVSAVTPVVAVLSSPLLKIVSITSPRAVISVEQQVLATVTLRNEGGTPVRVTMVRLKSSTEALASTTLATDVLLAGGGAVAAFGVTVSGRSHGNSILTSAVFGARDVLSNRSVGLSGNLATGPTIVVQPIPSLLIDSIEVTPTLVNSGQAVRAVVRVTNQGVPGVVLSRATLVFTGTTLQMPVLSVSEVLAGGAATSLVFDGSGVGVGSSTVTSAVVTAADVNSGRQVAIQSSAAVPTTVKVESRPGFKILSIVAERSRLSLDQSTAVTVAVRNDGELPVRISQGQLTLSGENFESAALTLDTLLQVGGGASITFAATARSAGPSLLSSATFVATNVGPGNPAPLVANEARKTELVALGPPQLRIAAIAPALTTLSVGQAMWVTATLKNLGEAPARIETLRLPAATLVVGDLTPSFVLDGFGGSASFTFHTTGSASGPSVLSTVAIGAIDAGNGVEAPVVSNLAQPITVSVQLPPDLELSSLATPRTTVMQGDAFDITATLTNRGEAATRLTRLDLVASNGRVRIPSLALERTLRSSESASFVFRALAESAGPTSIASAVVSAVDVNSGIGVSITQAATSGLELHVGAASLLRLVSIQPSRLRVTRSQSLRVEVGLRNDGSSDALISSARLELSNDKLESAAMTMSRTIPAAGGVAVFSFPVTAVSTGETLLTSASFAAVDTSTLRTAPLLGNLASPPAKVVIEEPPVLRVVGIGAAALAVSLGKTLRCTVDVLNAGGAKVRVTSVVLLLSNNRLLQSPTSFAREIPGQQTDRFALDTTAVQTGPVELLGAAVAGVDTNTELPAGLQPSTVTPLSLRVRAPPAVELLSIVGGRTEATLGQSFPVTVTFGNAGEDPATLTTASLTEAGVILTVPKRTKLAALPRLGTTTTYSFTATARSTGTVTLSTAVVESRDTDGARLPLAANRAVPVSIEVQSAPSLRIVSLSLSPSAAVTRAAITTGQGFSVFLTLGHGGGAPVDLTGASLVYNATQLSVPPLALSTGLPATKPGAVRLLTLEFPGIGAASGGRSGIATAVVSARDRNTGVPVRISGNSAVPLVLDVQPRGHLKLTGLTASRATVTVGQRFDVSASLENSGVAALLLKRVQLVASGPAADVPVLVEPITLTRPRSVVFTYSVVPRAVGTLKFTSAVVDALDLNSGEVERLRTNLAKPIEVVAQSPPALELVSIRAARGVVSIGEHLLVTVAVRNTGGAAATLTAARLSASQGRFTTGLLSMAATLAPTSSGSPVAVLSFDLTASTTGTEHFDGVELQARDANTGGSLPASVRTPAAVAQVRVLSTNVSPTASFTGLGELYLTDGEPVTAVYNAASTSDPDGDSIKLAWSIAAGAGISIASPSTTSTLVTFSSTGVKALRLRAVDGRGAFAVVTRTLTVTANSSPVVDAGDDRLAAVGFPLRMVGSARDDDIGDQLSLRWYPLDGANQTVASSGPAVALTPAAPGIIRLAFEASDARGGRATDTVSIEAMAPRTWYVSLLRGKTLISPPIQALRSDGEPISCRDLLEAAEASFLVSTREKLPGRSTFHTLLPGSGEDAPLEPGKGYLLTRRGPAAPLKFPGLPWPGRLPTRVLAAGSHLIGVIVGPGSPSDSEDLRTTLGVRFVGRVRAAAGTGRLELHVPQRSPLFEIQTGLGYLVTIPTTRQVVIPEGTE
ncbi:MAG: S8 family serine peptidase [Candidatus Wallbacteria bacterium]|nr:S8 family serine peptidase [Candidatus Wallbacteria bacterium]